MAQVGITVRATGPLFNGKAKPMTIKAVDNAIRQLMELGEERLDKKLRPRPAGVFKSTFEAGRKQVSKGNYRRNIHTKQKKLSAIIDDSGVVYGPWLESGREGTRFRGYGQMRQTATVLQRVSNKVVQTHLRKLAKRMNT